MLVFEGAGVIQLPICEASNGKEMLQVSLNNFSTKKNSCSVSGGDIKMIFFGFLGGATYKMLCKEPPFFN